LGPISSGIVSDRLGWQAGGNKKPPTGFEESPAMLSPAMIDATGFRRGDPSKLALRLADTLERWLLERGWPTGHVLGSETDLAREHGSTPQAMRQALRVLEGRDLARVRRGATGGLVLHQPSLAQTGRLMALHLIALAIPATQVAEARALVLDRLPRGRHAAGARRFAIALFHHIEAAWGADAPHAGATPPPGRDSRALQIARRILEQHRVVDAEIGTIDHLVDEHAACRAVIVQALRILENLGMAEAVRGRGGGFRRTAPAPCALVRATLPHFIAHDIDLALCGQLIEAINEINAARAARRDHDRVMLQTLVERVRPEDLVLGDISAQIAVLRHIAGAADNEVLHMLVRCLWYYCYHCMTRQPPAPPFIPIEIARPMVAALRRMADAVIAGDPVVAAQSMAQCGELGRPPSPSPQRRARG
jgi:DNA-binding FadR family transcriptional regulator